MHKLSKNYGSKTATKEASNESATNDEKCHTDCDARENHQMKVTSCNLIENFNSKSIFVSLQYSNSLLTNASVTTLYS